MAVPPAPVQVPSQSHLPRVLRLSRLWLMISVILGFSNTFILHSSLNVRDHVLTRGLESETDAIYNNFRYAL